MKRTNRRRTAVGVLATLLTVGMFGTASAYWSGSGTGAGSATTGDIQPVTLSPATASTQVYPGGQAAVALIVNNPNPGLVRVASLALDTTQGVGGFAVDGAHASCDVVSLSYTTQTNGGSGWSIPGGGSSSVTVSNALAMSASATDVCQGASFTVYLKAAF